MALNKKDVIQLLEKIAIYLELKGENPFKISAYRKAAQGLEKDERSLSEIDDFSKITGIGKGTSAVISEFVETGASETLQALEKEVPAGLIPLLKIPGLGGKKLAKLYKELEVTDAETLKKALEDGLVEQLPGFGKKSAEKMLTGLNEANERPERLPVAMMLDLNDEIEAYLQGIEEIQRFSLAGSLRRMRETIKDIDYIIATEQPLVVRDRLLEIPHLKDVIAKGETKVSVTLEGEFDINVDFRMVTDLEFPTTLHHFTGSKDHNVAMRQMAKARGEKISEYGVEVEETGEVLTFKTETDFFNHFGLSFIPPEAREDTGEVDTFKLDADVHLLEDDDILGDLHMHTTWSDGALSVEEMVNLCRERGYRYIAITDHSKYLRVANGLNEERLKKQRAEIDMINEKYDDIHIFHGVEMDILPDGSLDFDDAFLSQLDYTIAAIHSSFNQSEDEIMKRLFTAMESPYVNLIAHPTGRLIGRRPGYPVDTNALIQKAKETNTALEINANPNRLDLTADVVRKAKEAGVPIAINTDAHHKEMLSHMKYGVSVAKKAWLEKNDVINTWSIEQLKAFMNRKQ